MLIKQPLETPQITWFTVVWIVQGFHILVSNLSKSTLSTNVGSSCILCSIFWNHSLSTLYWKEFLFAPSTSFIIQDPQDFMTNGIYDKIRDNNSFLRSGTPMGLTWDIAYTTRKYHSDHSANLCRFPLPRPTSLEN